MVISGVCSIDVSVLVKCRTNGCRQTFHTRELKTKIDALGNMNDWFNF